LRLRRAVWTRLLPLWTQVAGAAEEAGFDLLLTADKNMRYQQNLTGRRIALIVLSTPQWPLVRLHLESIAAVVNAATPDSYGEVEIPVC
jgi:hypothetical protein